MTTFRDRRRRRRERRGSRGDAGFSLIEVTTACVLLGMSGAVITGGLFTVVRTSKLNAQLARVEAVLSSSADRITGWAYTPCPAASGTGSYSDVVKAAASAVGWPASTVSITSVEYFDPTGPSSHPWSASNDASGTGCNPGVSATSPRTVQKITIRVSTPDGSYSRELEVVKNNVIPEASSL